MRVKLRVKEIAETRGFNMSSLSRKADLNIRTIQSIYRDSYHEVSYLTLVKLAKALEVTVDDLVLIED